MRSCLRFPQRWLELKARKRESVGLSVRARRAAGRPVQGPVLPSVVVLTTLLTLESSHWVCPTDKPPRSLCPRSLRSSTVLPSVGDVLPRVVVPCGRELEQGKVSRIWTCSIFLYLYRFVESAKYSALISVRSSRRCKPSCTSFFGGISPVYRSREGMR